MNPCQVLKTYHAQVWLVIETAIIYFLYPETKGPTLEELAYCESNPA